MSVAMEDYAEKWQKKPKPSYPSGFSDEKRIAA
jgi:hypothetical protein